MFAVMSCWSEDTIVPSPNENVTRTRLIKTLSMASSSVSISKDTLLVSANGLKALHEAGVLTQGDSEATNLLLAIVDGVLSASLSSGSSFGGSSIKGVLTKKEEAAEDEVGEEGEVATGELEASVLETRGGPLLPTPTLNPALKSRLRKLSKFSRPEGTGGAVGAVDEVQENAPIMQAPPQDMHFTHQNCFIAGDESEVSYF